MGSLTADVGDCSHHALWKLALHAQTPLLHVRPDRLLRYGGDIDGERNAATNTDIALHWVRLSHGEHQWRAAFERSRIGFFRGAVFVEHAVAATNGRLPIALRVPG